MGERIQVSWTLGIKKTELQLKYTGLLYTVVELNRPKSEDKEYTVVLKY